MSDVEIHRIGWADVRGRVLRAAFDEEMDERYGDGPVSDTQAIRLDNVFGVDEGALVDGFLGTWQGEPAAHAALFRRPEADEFEIRKVFVLQPFRGRGISHRMMQAVEDRAVELGGRRVVLDTGPRQPDAVALYLSRGFTRIAPFAPYDGITDALCFAKDLAPAR